MKRRESATYRARVSGFEGHPSFIPESTDLSENIKGPLGIY
jgi:hypothetical protein